MRHSVETSRELPTVWQNLHLRHSAELRHSVEMSNNSLTAFHTIHAAVRRFNFKGGIYTDTHLRT